MTRGHRISVLADLAVLLRTVAAVVLAILGRGQRAVAVERGVGHVGIDLSHLDIAQLLLEELEVPSAISHLGVESGADSFIVSLRPHSISGVDQSLLPLDLLVNILDSLLIIHGGGEVARYVRAGRGL